MFEALSISYYTVLRRSRLVSVEIVLGRIADGRESGNSLQQFNVASAALSPWFSHTASLNGS